MAVRFPLPALGCASFHSTSIHCTCLHTQIPCSLPSFEFNLPALLCTPLNLSLPLSLSSSHSCSMCVCVCVCVCVRARARACMCEPASCVSLLWFPSGHTLPWRARLAIVRQITVALTLLHHAAFVHGTLRLCNIFIGMVRCRPAGCVISFACQASTMATVLLMQSDCWATSAYHPSVVLR